MKILIQMMFALVMVGAAGSAMSQGVLVNGRVLDENKEGIPGVTVLEKGTSNGTISDISGNYKLIVAGPKSVLQFYYIGFRNQEIRVGNQSVIDISMEENVEALEEVVVIGYGVQKKRVLTGSIESVAAEEITKTPIARIDQALQGRTAGVQVLSQSGQPGEQGSVRIRGVGTDYNSEPLYLVDGIAVQSIDYLNPNDIESMEVLKDAASASIYGARAANGVVLITTKRGKQGASSVTYSGYYGLQNAANKVALLNGEEYQQLMSAAGLKDLDGRTFDRNEIPAHNTDWQDELFTRNASMESHDITVLGGGEKTNYSSSISYFRQNGIIGDDKSQFKRYTARLSTNTAVSKVFNWGNTITYARISSRGVISNGSFSGEYGSALNIDPVTPVFETDQSRLSQLPYGSNPYVIDGQGRAYAITRNVGGEVVNPLARLHLQNKVVDRDQLLGSVFAESEPIVGLKLKTTASLDLSMLEENSYQPLYYLSETFVNSSLTNINKKFERNVRLQTEQTANYTREIGRSNFNFLIGTTYLEENFENLEGKGQNVNTSNPDLLYLNLTTDSTRQAVGGAKGYKLFSIFSRLLYDYNDRVSLSITNRRDGSSKFGSNNRFGEFWSFGASWVINEEPFFPNIDFLSFLKLRASWGQNGNDQIVNDVFTSVIDANSAYNFQNGAVSGSPPSYVENKDIKWESAQQLDLGLEATFWDNRLSLTLDYYKETTQDLLQSALYLSSLGVSLSYDNVGTMINEGVEIALDWQNKVGQVDYVIGFNAAYNSNVMAEVANPAGFINGVGWGLNGEVTRTIEGHPVTSFFGYKTDGIFQSSDEVNAHINNEGLPIQPNAEPGDIRFVDVDGDGKISDNDRTFIGSPIPDWVLGANISLDYKNFSFYALLSGQLGNEIFNGLTRTDLRTSNKQTWMLEAWTEDKPSSSVPRFSASDNNQNYTRATDLVNIEDGAFIRLKNIQIGYDLPKEVVQRLRMKSWNIYVSAENLLTFTRYRGSDPEVGSPVDWEGSGVSSIRDMGIDRGIYPQARTLRFGTTVSF